MPANCFPASPHKVMSGFTDEFYKATTKAFQDRHAIAGKRSYYDVNEGMYPSVWFNAVEVSYTFHQSLSCTTVSDHCVLCVVCCVLCVVCACCVCVCVVCVLCVVL